MTVQIPEERSMQVSLGEVYRGLQRLEAKVDQADKERRKQRAVVLAAAIGSAGSILTTLATHLH